jgi:hypothetical protein
MTTGALIFAFNNEATDYVRMAAWGAENIRRHLNIPVAVVTDADPADPGLKAFDQVVHAKPDAGGTRWFEDYASTVTWHNAGRVDAYNLTPWDRTLVLDADYVVACSDLKLILEYNTDFMCHRSAINMNTGRLLKGLNIFGRHSMPMWWATVMLFRRSNTAQYIFDCMQMIRNNWEHYRALYGIDNKTYRNDFALSIALGIVSGHTGKVDEIPWPLMTVMPDTVLAGVADETDSYHISYHNTDHQPKHIHWRCADFHAMGKQHLENIIASH